MSTTEPGAPERFSALYGQLYGRVHAYARRRVGPDAADEVASETFLIAWRRFDAIPPDPLPWLYGVARNVVLRLHTTAARQEAARRAIEHERPPGDPGEAHDVPLWEAWAKLRPGDREILALVAWEELAVADAARVLGCPAPVFSVRLHRARKRLERLLDAAPQAVLTASALREVS